MERWLVPCTKGLKGLKGYKRRVYPHFLPTHDGAWNKKRQRNKPSKRKRRRGQKGGILPLAILPLLALAGKAAAAGAISGAAGYGVKKGLETATKKK